MIPVNPSRKQPTKTPHCNFRRLHTMGKTARLAHHTATWVDVQWHPNQYHQSRSSGSDRLGRMSTSCSSANWALGRKPRCVRCAVPHSNMSQPMTEIWPSTCMVGSGRKENIANECRTVENYRIFKDTSQSTHKKNAGRSAGTILHIGIIHAMCKIHHNNS